MGNVPKKRVSKMPPERVRTWLSALLKTGKRLRIRPDINLTKLAGLLALTGDVGENLDVYQVYTGLFLHPDRRARWAQAIDVIPADAESVKRVAAAVSAFTRITGQRLPSRMNLTNTVQVAAQLRDPEVYVKKCLSSGMGTFGAVFHPNTFKAEQRTMRGKYGPTADPTYTNTVVVEET